MIKKSLLEMEFLSEEKIRFLAVLSSLEATSPVESLWLFSSSIREEFKSNHNFMNF